MRDIPADSAETDAAFRRTITTASRLIALFNYPAKPTGRMTIANIQCNIPHCLRFPAETCREIKFNKLERRVRVWQSLVIYQTGGSLRVDARLALIFLYLLFIPYTRTYAWKIYSSYYSYLSNSGYLRDTVSV